MTRVITGLLLAILACYLILFAPWPVFQAAALAVGIICYHEFAALVAAHGIRKPYLFGLAAGVLFLLVPQYAVAGLSILAVTALSAALRYDSMEHILPQVSAELFGAIYTFLPWHFAARLRERSIHWLMFALALNWFGDTFAYYTGRAFGKHHLAPIVSPKKTWEGACGSAVGSIVFGLIYMGYFQPQVTHWKVALIALAANAAGQFGDLAESAMKRGAGVKDSGTMLPGHGGLLDRLDSSLFSLPVVYVLSMLV